MYKKDFPLFRYSAAVCAGLYLILSLSRPDEWMARYNFAYKEEWIESYDEIQYLFSRDLLSAVDAEQISHLKGDPQNLISYCREVVDRYDNEPGWTYSIGEARAKHAAERFFRGIWTQDIRREHMRTVNVSEITKNIREMCIEANHYLSKDMETVLKQSRETEESPLGRQILDQLSENLQIAADDKIPICQDTGMAVVFLEVGQDVHLEGGAVEDAVNEGSPSGIYRWIFTKVRCQGSD